MKKLVLLLAVAFSVSMFSCGGGQEGENADSAKQAEATETPAPEAQAPEADAVAPEAEEAAAPEAEAAAPAAEEAAAAAPAEAGK